MKRKMPAKHDLVCWLLWLTSYDKRRTRLYNLVRNLIRLECAAEEAIEENSSHCYIANTMTDYFRMTVRSNNQRFTIRPRSNFCHNWSPSIKSRLVENHICYSSSRLAMADNINNGTSKHIGIFSTSNEITSSLILMAIRTSLYKRRDYLLVITESTYPTTGPGSYLSWEHRRDASF